MYAFLSYGSPHVWFGTLKNGPAGATSHFDRISCDQGWELDAISLSWFINVYYFKENAH